jgi:hypothetical protein
MEQQVRIALKSTSCGRREKTNNEEIFCSCTTTVKAAANARRESKKIPLHTQRDNKRRFIHLFLVLAKCPSHSARRESKSRSWSTKSRSKLEEHSGRIEISNATQGFVLIRNATTTTAIEEQNRFDDSFFLCTRSSNPNDLLLFSSAKEGLLQLPHENGWPTRKQIVRVFRAIVATSQVIVGKGTHAGPGLGEGAEQPNVHEHDTIYARIKPFILALILTHGPIRLPGGENFCGHQQYKQAVENKPKKKKKKNQRPSRSFPYFKSWTNQVAE